MSGQIPTVFCFHHIFETLHLDHNFMDHPLEIDFSEGRGFSSILLDSYDRFADFVVPNFRSNGVFWGDSGGFKSLSFFRYNACGLYLHRSPVGEDNSRGLRL